jgi:two-component system, LytTR family, sensor kinase
LCGVQPSPGMMQERFRKITWIVLRTAVLFLVLFIYLHFSETDRLPDFRKNISGLILSIVIGSFIAVALYYLNRKLDTWIPWRKSFTARLMAGYTSNVAVALLITLSVGAVVLQILGPQAFWPEFTSQDEDLLLKLVILYLTSLFIYNVVYAILFSYQHYTVAQIENIQRDRRQLELQFEALKSQISPHYLFNSLNTISSLIFKDLPSAEQFIRRLAQTYQFILTTQNKRYVRLQEEVDFLQSYYYLLRIRFQQQLEVEINLPQSIMDSKIPPLTLQMLVENAVKHNPVRNDKKLFIYISAMDNTYIRVVNTKTGMRDHVTSFQIGLENIQKRYQFFTDRPIQVKDEEKFSVSLPLILASTKLKVPAF